MRTTPPRVMGLPPRLEAGVVDVAVAVPDDADTALTVSREAHPTPRHAPARLHLSRHRRRRLLHRAERQDGEHPEQPCEGPALLLRRCYLLCEEGWSSPLPRIVVAEGPRNASEGNRKFEKRNPRATPCREPGGDGQRNTSRRCFPEPLAERPDGSPTLRNVLKRPRTVGRFRQVDGLAEELSAFGHGDAGRVLQHAS